MVPATLASRGNLLEMEILRPQPRPSKLDSLGLQVGIGIVAGSLKESSAHSGLRTTVLQYSPSSTFQSNFEFWVIRSVKIKQHYRAEKVAQQLRA